MEFGDEISQEQLLDLFVFYSKSKRKISYFKQFGFNEDEVTNNTKGMVEKYFQDIEDGTKESEFLIAAANIYRIYFPDPGDKIANAIKNKKYKNLENLLSKSKLKVKDTDTTKYHLLIALNDDVKAAKILEPYLDDSMKPLSQEMIPEAPTNLIHYYLSHENEVIRQKSIEQFIKDFERQPHLSDEQKIQLFSAAIVVIYKSDKTQDKSEVSKFLNNQVFQLIDISTKFSSLNLDINKLEKKHLDEASEKFIENYRSIKIIRSCKNLIDYELIKNKQMHPKLKTILRGTSSFLEYCLNYIKVKKIATVKKDLHKHLEISNKATENTIKSIVKNLSSVINKSDNGKPEISLIRKAKAIKYKRVSSA